MTVDAYAGKGVLLFDGECPLCQRSVAILKKLDWLGRLAYHNGRDLDGIPPHTVPLDPDKLVQEMHLLTPDRTKAPAGYSAFRWIAWRLPLTVLFAPLMYVPGIPWIGNRIYRWVAKNRMNLVPCHDGQCRVPLKRK